MEIKYGERATFVTLRKGKSVEIGRGEGCRRDALGALARVEVLDRA